MAQPFRFASPPNLSRPFAWALGIVLPLAVFVVQTSARGLTEPIPFVPFFLAISIVSWCGGWGPGYAASLLSTVLGYLFLRSSENAVRAGGAQVGALLFLPVAVLIASFGAFARAAARERERWVEELRRSQTELSEAVRARDNFLSIASHELKTPLTSLQLVMRTITRQVAIGKLRTARDVSAKLPVLERQVHRLGHLVGEMLDVSRIVGHRLHLELQDVDLGDLVREVVHRFEGEIQEAGSTVTVDVPAGLRGRWDPLRVDQVVTNLVSNAIKYGRAQPISIRVERRDDAAAIEVRDRGIGIEPDEMWKVFARFERAQGAMHYGGLGLGLWIAREIVAAHGGSIDVKSTPGAGTTFTVALPLASAAAADAPQSARA